jgi:hypothetical protein
LPGDNESPSWIELLANPNFVAAIKGADVLLAPHHGQGAGYCADLFKAMGKPKLVVISDGRFGDTSATDRYCAQATGWTVYNRLGVGKECKCVTTRSDGHITINIGWINEAERRNFLNVTTSKPEPDLSGLAALMFGRPPERQGTPSKLHRRKRDLTPRYKRLLPGGFYSPKTSAMPGDTHGDA